MEDNKFVRELKEMATGKRLPTAEDLGPGYTSPFEEEPTKPITHQNKPESENLKKPSQEKVSEEELEKVKEREEEFKKELFSKIKKLHEEGKTIDEIYAILREQGYSYQNIEEAVLELVKKEKTSKKEIKIEKDISKETIKEIPTTQKSKPDISEEEMYKSEFAPLFVRIGKYKETLETLENLENYLKGMSRLFELSNELEKIRANNLSALSKMYQKASSTASKLYSGLLKPKGLKLEGRRESQVEMEKLDEVISDLNKELTILRDEIDKIKSME